MIYMLRLRQMLKAWRKRAGKSKISCVPSDVPPGHVALIVGVNSTRYIVRAKHLNHPLLMNLLRKAEEEYGFDNNHGPVCIPCDESAFEETLRVVTRSPSRPIQCRATENMPLLRSEKQIC